MNDEHQGFFYIIPAKLAESGDSTKAILYGLISSLINKDGYCWASNKYLSTKLGKKSQRIITKYLKELKEEGWITDEVDSDGGNKRKIFLSIVNPIEIKRYRSRNKTLYPYGNKTLHSNITKSNIKEYAHKNNNSQYEITLHDGTKAVNKFGTWIDPVSKAVIDTKYYKELSKI